MNYDPETDDAILEGLLYRADARSAAEDDPDEEEMFALFAEGRLQGEDRDAFLSYLDTHPQMRRAVRAYAELSEAEALASVPAPCQPEMAPSHSTSSSPSWLAAGMERMKQLTIKLPTLIWPRSGPTIQHPPSGAGSIAMPWFYPKAAFAMAAMLLVALAAFLWFVGSPSNGMLTAWAIGFPAYPTSKGVDGSETSIEHMLRHVEDEQERMQLKQGFDLVLLPSPQNSQKAHSIFQSVLDANPYSYYGKMGQGLAYLYDGKYQEASNEFTVALRIDPDSTDAQINLALSLTELEKEGKATINRALEEWQKAKAHRLGKEDRERVEQAIETLESKHLSSSDKAVDK